MFGQLQEDSLRPALSAFTPNSTVSLFENLATRPQNNLFSFFWKAQLTPVHLPQEGVQTSLETSPPQLLVPPPPHPVFTLPLSQVPLLFGCIPGLILLLLLLLLFFFVCFSSLSLTLVYKKKHHTHPHTVPPTQHTDSKAEVVTGKPWLKASS